MLDGITYIITLEQESKIRGDRKLSEYCSSEDVCIALDEILDDYFEGEL